jgi:hypothetical protein
MKRLGVITAAVLSLLLGAPAFAYASQEQQGGKQKQEQQDKKQGKPEKQAKPEKQQGGQQAKPQKEQQQPSQQQDRSKQDQLRARGKQDQQRAQQQQDKSKQDQQRAQPQQQGERLSQQRQQQLVEQQQQRLTQYRQHLDQQQRVLQQQTAQLQQQKRTAQYRFHEDYLGRLRQQQEFLQNDRHPDYDHDPYFYTAPIYRYHRGGRYYEVNQYGADLLRQALNNGYQEGFRAGQADREDRWRSDYLGCYAYQDASYGYNGYYLERSDYNYYFRQGFRRGYEDGYSSQYRYGRYSGGSYIMLDIVLSQVLSFQSLR